MERDYTYLRADFPAGFGWMTQDLHASGAVGDASLATAEKGEAALDHGARAFVALLRRRGEIRSGAARAPVLSADADAKIAARLKLGGDT